MIIKAGQPHRMCGGEALIVKPPYYGVEASDVTVRCPMSDVRCAIWRFGDLAIWRFVAVSFYSCKKICSFIDILVNNHLHEEEEDNASFLTGGQTSSIDWSMKPN